MIEVAGTRQSNSISIRISTCCGQTVLDTFLTFSRQRPVSPSGSCRMFSPTYRITGKVAKALMSLEADRQLVATQLRLRTECRPERSWCAATTSLGALLAHEGSDSERRGEVLQASRATSLLALSAMAEVRVSGDRKPVHEVPHLSTGRTVRNLADRPTAPCGWRITAAIGLSARI